jgi:hypothetical protein
LPDIGRLGAPPLPSATMGLQRNAADGLLTKPSNKNGIGSRAYSLTIWGFGIILFIWGKNKIIENLNKFGLFA